MAIQGEDGYSADWSNIWFDAAHVTGVARNGFATGTCGKCGTQTPFTGRPGTRKRSFECRTCKVNNHIDITFVFWSLN